MRISRSIDLSKNGKICNIAIVGTALSATIVQITKEAHTARSSLPIIYDHTGDDLTVTLELTRKALVRPVEVSDRDPKVFRKVYIGSQFVDRMSDGGDRLRATAALNDGICIVIDDLREECELLCIRNGPGGVIRAVATGEILGVIRPRTAGLSASKLIIIRFFCVTKILIAVVFNAFTRVKRLETEKHKREDEDHEQGHENRASKDTRARREASRLPIAERTSAAPTIVRRTVHCHILVLQAVAFHQASSYLRPRRRIGDARNAFAYFLSGREMSASARLYVRLAYTRMPHKRADAPWGGRNYPRAKAVSLFVLRSDGDSSPPTSASISLL